jgi:hypothetical protein
MKIIIEAMIKIPSVLIFTFAVFAANISLGYTYKFTNNLPNSDAELEVNLDLCLNTNLTPRYTVNLSTKPGGPEASASAGLCCASSFRIKNLFATTGKIDIPLGNHCTDNNITVDNKGNISLNGSNVGTFKGY